MPRWGSGLTGLPDYWAEAVDQLRAADPALGRVIEGCGEGGLVCRDDPFVTLARSIVGQQISVRAAATIWSRLEEAVDAVTPEAVSKAGVDRLRGAGLTRQKSSYLHDIAGAFAGGDMGPHVWSDADDEAVIEALCGLRGVGRWTAETFLIFHLLRPDVLPLADIGLRRAVAMTYRSGEETTADHVAEIAEAWRPWRSVATWYLWRSLDPEPVAY